MKKKFVYVIVLLTLCSLSLTLAPKAMAQKENIKILSYSWYIDSLGYLTVVGEVQNTGSTAVDSVILTGSVTTVNGEVPSYTTIYASDLLPQQRAPFYMEFAPDQSIGSWYSTEVNAINLSVFRANATTSYLYPDLKITDQQAYIGGGSTDQGVYWVSGHIQNIGSQTAKNVRILGTFYNSTGQVVAIGGYTTETVAGSLAPSASAPFKFGAFDLNQSQVTPDRKISTYSLLLQVEEPVLNGTAPIVTPTATPLPATSGSPNPTISNPSGTSSGSNPTGSESSTWIYATVAVIVIVAVVAALVFLRRRRK